MALRLRRDVQKASYYVWFLGAQEARGLRGPRVLYPAVPRLLERSRDQEPLKVTLQVSHKGLKIVQGSAKHFIPHGAITCSMRSGDIVACVLLLYNPATRCPLHVHAYRCDSETTAEALHAQLMVLVDRPENQRRFAELETRLGLAPSAGGGQKISNPSSQNGGRRFDSSLGSDTGTSTRESDCSEEPPASAPTSLYDSLAAELRQKLGAGSNGNGPPLLLPPRDYDTVHRSQGNLTAIELRRCRTSAVVGAVLPAAASATAPLSVPVLSSPARGVSSRGSSGFGSDPTPDSPERQDRHSSSDEEWNNDIESSVFLMHDQKRTKPSVKQQPQPVYPAQEYHHTQRSVSPVREEKPIRYHARQSPGRYDGYENERVSPRRYKDYTSRYRDEIIPYKDEMRYRKSVDLDDLYQDDLANDPEPYRDPYAVDDAPKYRRESSLSREEELFYENENNKYRQDYRQDYREPSARYRSGASFKHAAAPSPAKYQSRDYAQDGPVKRDQDHLGYREIGKYDDKNAKYNRSQQQLQTQRSTLAEDRQRAPSVNSTNSVGGGAGGSILLASPRERFNDAKEKFQMMERARQQELVKPRKPKKDNGRAWSSDEEDVHYRPRPNLRRHVSSAAPHHMPDRLAAQPKLIASSKLNKHNQMNPQPHPRTQPPQPGGGYVEPSERDQQRGRIAGFERMVPSKSLGNLSKGYRHSYAEPQPATRRQMNGRVGIAAVHQY